MTVSPTARQADWPEFCTPVQDTTRFEAPTLVDDGDGAELSVRARPARMQGLLI